ncbi:MAG TPA: hypothetical protein VLM89_01180, partial [Phycisphaerae bacterium]|nr:hypothetical protein [Phycisphaerae bacterium]
MNSTCNSLKAAHAHHLEYVDLLLPATAPPPEPARRINFFKALGLYWLMPRRFGPHLAVGTWKRAWAAHVLAVVLTAAIAAAWYVDFSGLHTGSLHDLRVQAAEWVIVTAAGSASVPWWVPPLIVIGG